MTVVALRPTSTAANTGVVTGAGSAHAALSDDSDASYVGYQAGQNSTLGMADLTLPAGAVLLSAVVRVRVARSGVWNLDTVLNGIIGSERSVWVTWSTPTTVEMTPRLASGAISDALLDATTLFITSTSQLLNVYEAYLDVRYVTVPVATVTGPTGTVTNTTTPTVTWGVSLDSDGGAATHAHIKIFTAAQYGAGGFDPTTSTALLDSGVINPFGVTTAPLADGTYRAYVRVAQSVNGVQHWSAWAFSGFTISVVRPAAPTMTLTAQPTQGRVKIDLAANAGAATTDRMELQRSVDGGVTWQAVRNQWGDDGLVLSATTATIYDYESLIGTATLYRAAAAHNYSSVYAASAWSATGSVTVTSTQWWLKDVLRPALNVPIELVTYGEVTRAARHGILQALGATVPVVIADTRAGATGSSVVQTRTNVAHNTLLALAEQTITLLLQGPDAAGEPNRYIRVGDLAVSRVVENINIPVRRFTVPWVETAAPTGAQTGAQYA